MRIRNGKLKLDANEKRIGNFIIRDENEHVKASDLNQVFTHRADKRTPIGLFLKQCYDKLGADESTGKGLGNWLAVIFTAFSVVPDVEWLEAVMAASEACMKRHPEAYGYPAGEPTEQEDAAAAQEVKEMMEFEEQVKQMPDGDDDKKD